MKLNTNNYKYKELLKWYRKALNQPAKKVVIDHISEIKKYVGGFGFPILIILVIVIIGYFLFKYFKIKQNQ